MTMKKVHLTEGAPRRAQLLSLAPCCMMKNPQVLPSSLFIVQQPLQLHGTTTFLNVRLFLPNQKLGVRHYQGHPGPWLINALKLSQPTTLFRDTAATPPPLMHKHLLVTKERPLDQWSISKKTTCQIGVVTTRENGKNSEGHLSSVKRLPKD